MRFYLPMKEELPQELCEVAARPSTTLSILAPLLILGFLVLVLLGGEDYLLLGLTGS